MSRFQLDDGLVLTFLGSQPATAMNSLPSQTSGDTHDHSEENRINGEGFDDLRTVPRVDDEEVPAIHTHSQLQAGNNAFVAESQSQFQEAIQHRYVLVVLLRVNKTKLWSAQRQVFQTMNDCLATVHGVLNLHM